jgi:predicted secreted protein
MNNAIRTACIFLGLACVCHPLAAQSGGEQSKITARAVWKPTARAMTEIRKSCDSMGADVALCFVVGMRAHKASKEALRFATLTGGDAYMREFGEKGIVDAACVEYPYRANENRALMLLNGTPSMIDVDDSKFFPAKALDADPRMIAIRSQYPNVMTMPGNRSGTRAISVQRVARGITRYIASYKLLDGCHACTQVGEVRAGFDFDRKGNFTGAVVVGVKALAVKHGSQDGRPGKEPGASDPSETVFAQIGSEFELRLESNPTTGFSWTFDSTRSNGIVKLLRSDYETEGPRAVGSGGTERFLFKVLKSGTVTLKFSYRRPWEKDKQPVKERSFTVVAGKR